MEAHTKRKTFALVLIKPSHYDDDGYVIQWLRSAIPSNSLAVLYGLAADCASAAGARRRRRRSTSPPSTRPTPASDPSASSADRAADGAAWSGSSACSRTSFRARSTSRGRCARAASRSCIGGFHVSGCLSHAAGHAARHCSEAQALGISLFAGEAEGRLDEVLRDALARHAEAALQFHGRSARRSRARRCRSCRRDASSAPRAA